MILCHVCGNQITLGSQICRFCGSEQQEKPLAPMPFLQKAVNLKRGLPTVEIALRRLILEIDTARREGVTLLTLIHGYGASGQGGIIREECRKSLDQMQFRKEIGGFIPGEDYNGKTGQGKALVRRYPQLNRDRNITSRNPGITVVIL